MAIPYAASNFGVRRSTRAEKLDSCARHIVQSDGVPAFCEHINDILARTMSVESSPQELARAILRDVGLTSKTLTAANSPIFNRAGRRIMSVAHAITLLGWDNVRSMMGTIRYVEHFTAHSPGIRELLILSILNAVHSRELAIVTGHPRPDEAYVCGLLRNVGEVLVACHYPQEYSQIIVDMNHETIPARIACLRYLDFHWDELGRRVAESWKMPALVSACMQEGDTAAPGLERSLASITDYASQLTHQLYRKGDHYETVHLHTVTCVNGSKTFISVRDLARIVYNAFEEMQQTFPLAEIQPETLRLSHQAERAQKIVDGLTTFTAAAIATLEHLVDEAIRSVDEGMFDVTSLLKRVLDGICATGFDTAVFGLMNETHTIVRGRLAGGENARATLSHFHFPVDRVEGPVRAAMMHHTDIVVDRKRDARYDRSTLVSALDPSAFALLPVVLSGRAIGCIYAGRSSPSPGFEEIRPSLCRARDVIVKAFGRTSGRTTSGGPADSRF